MRRALASLLLATLVVLAGCGGSAGTGTTTGTATGAPPGSVGPASPASTGTSTPSATPTPSLADVEFPDGASADGFDDPAGLATGQRGLLNGTSFGLHYAVESSAGTGTDGSLEMAYTPERSLTVVRSGGGVNTSVWTAPNATSIRRWRGRRVRYARYGRNTSLVADLYRDYGLQVAPQVLRRYLRAFSYEATGAFRRGGHAFVRYGTEGVNESYSLGGVTYAGGNLTVVLRDDGLVTRLSGTTTIETETGTERRRVRYEVTGLGTTTVTAPDWVDERIPTFDAEVVGEDVVAITHAGGPAIDAGRIRVSVGPSGLVNVSDFSPGDTIYVTATLEGRTLNLTAHGELPDPPKAAVDFLDPRSVVVTVADRTVSVTLLVGRNDTASRLRSLDLDVDPLAGAGGSVAREVRQRQLEVALVRLPDGVEGVADVG